MGTVDCEIETPGRRRERRIYHINLLKKWHVLQAALVVQDPGDESVEVGQAGVVTWDDLSD